MSDLWKTLKAARRPLLLYGMGNGADKIIAVLDRFGIPWADTFASDGFVRGQFFHGKRVLSYSEAKEKYGDFTVLVSFGSSLPDVCSRVEEMEKEVELFAPDVPVCGEMLYTEEWEETHRKELDILRASLADEKSREVLDAVLSYKLTGKLAFLRSCETAQNDDLAALFPHDFTAYADLGAYTGDTIREMTARYPAIRSVIAMEPSAKSAAKLRAYADTVTRSAITVVEAAAWDREENLSFADGSARNSTVSSVNDKEKSGAKLRTVMASPLDAHALFAGERLLIKYDVEGAEVEALRGSTRTIRENESSLIVSAYHRTDDFLILPPLLSSLCPNHRLYLRKHPGFPAWDVNFYVTK